MSDTFVTARIVADRWVVTAVGEFDVRSAPLLRERLLDQVTDGQVHLVVDLTGVTFMDSSALGVLVGTWKRVKVAGGSLRLVCPQERIAKIFRITGLDRVLPIDGTVEAALAARPTLVDPDG